MCLCANCQAVDKNGDTVLAAAVRRGELNIIDSIIKRGLGQLEDTNSNGDDTISTALKYCEPSTIMWVMKYLLENNPEVKNDAKSRNMLFHWAVLNNKMENAAALLTLEPGIQNYLWSLKTSFITLLFLFSI